jgi:hypothetical protein
MARAIPARDEDHRRRTNPDEIACIVAGRRQDRHRRQVVLARRLRDQFTQVRIELIRWRVDQRHHCHRTWHRVLVAKRCDSDAGRIEHRSIRMAQVDAEGDACGHHGRHIWFDHDPADGEFDLRIDPADVDVERGGHPRKGGERVAPLMLR